MPFGQGVAPFAFRRPAPSESSLHLYSFPSRPAARCPHSSLDIYENHSAVCPGNRSYCLHRWLRRRQCAAQQKRRRKAKREQRDRARLLAEREGLDAAFTMKGKASSLQVAPSATIALYERLLGQFRAAAQLACKNDTQRAQTDQRAFTALLSEYRVALNEWRISQEAKCTMHRQLSCGLHWLYILQHSPRAALKRLKCPGLNWLDRRAAGWLATC